MIKKWQKGGMSGTERGVACGPRTSCTPSGIKVLECRTGSWYWLPVNIQFYLLSLQLKVAIPPRISALPPKLYFLKSVEFLCVQSSLSATLKQPESDANLWPTSGATFSRTCAWCLGSGVWRCALQGLMTAVVPDSGQGRLHAGRLTGGALLKTAVNQALYWWNNLANWFLYRAAPLCIL